MFLLIKYHFLIRWHIVPLLVSVRKLIFLSFPNFSIGNLVLEKVKFRLRTCRNNTIGRVFVKTLITKIHILSVNIHIIKVFWLFYSPINRGFIWKYHIYSAMFYIRLNQTSASRLSRTRTWYGLYFRFNQSLKVQQIDGIAE